MNLVFQPYSNEKAGVNNYGIGFRMKIFDNGENLLIIMDGGMVLMLFLGIC
jgi:hypothetical protein